MRYLKATAQDRSGNGRADMVILQFFERPAGDPDELVHEAVAVDITADGATEILLPGDINFDGYRSAEDKALLKTFSDVFLQQNWFNPGETWRRYLTMRVARWSGGGVPTMLKLSFHQCCTSQGKRVLMHSVMGYDGDNDGIVESIINTGLKRDRSGDHRDSDATKALCDAFLAFGWHTPGRLRTV